MKKQVIREGDTVKVINPIFIYKWGYDNNIKDVTEELLQNDKIRESITELFNIVKADNELTKVAYEAVIRPLAYNVVKSRMKSGSERKLWTQELLEYQDITCSVYQTKIIKTGKYVPPYCYVSYFGEHDDEPGHLSEEKTHKLLKLSLLDLDWEREYWIEECNVEKVNVSNQS